uniref:Uncharacterized protein n=1 Tax=Anguilla anguilla TaxID=7936 RepID=A0A0E9UYK8_ANGAN
MDVLQYRLHHRGQSVMQPFQPGQDNKKFYKILYTTPHFL